MKTLQSSGEAAEGPLSPEIASLGPWFHNLHLPDGTQTAPDHPLGDFPRQVWQRFDDKLPEDLSDCRALDIGCNAGFYAFELARRGAEVMAVDIDDRYLEQARWAAHYLDPDDRVTFVNKHMYRLRELGETFDLVLMLGLLYHLRYPLLALDIIGSIADDWLVFQSLSVPGNEVVEKRDRLKFTDRDEMRRPGWPKLAFVEGELAGDPTNWWVPNHACCRALLEETGFKIVSEPADELYVCRRDPHRQPSIERHAAEFEAAAGEEV